MGKFLESDTIALTAFSPTVFTILALFREFKLNIDAYREEVGLYRYLQVTVNPAGTYD